MKKSQDMKRRITFVKNIAFFRVLNEYYILFSSLVYLSN